MSVPSGARATIETSAGVGAATAASFATAPPDATASAGAAGASVASPPSSSASAARDPIGSIGSDPNMVS